MGRFGQNAAAEARACGTSTMKPLAPVLGAACTAESGGKRKTTAAKGEKPIALRRHKTAATLTVANCVRESQNHGNLVTIALRSGVASHVS